MRRSSCGSRRRSSSPKARQTLRRHLPDSCGVTTGDTRRADRIRGSATTSIPIVFAVVNDPVAQGFIASMAHPGGNITGFSFLDYSMVGKSLEMLKQIAPSVVRVAVMFNPDTYPYYKIHLRSFETVARALSLELVGAPVHSPAEIDESVAKLGRQPGSALLVTPDPFTVVHRGAIIGAAEKHRIPATYSYRQHVQEGALMSYGADTIDISDDRRPTSIAS